jgi:hypothetical protein
MNIIDLRKKLLQSSEKRVYCDRRKIPYQFGSQEWLECMNNNNFDHPQQDRRQLVRREADSNPATLDSNEHKTSHKRMFLTAGEKRLLQDIYLTDFDDLDS